MSEQIRGAGQPSWPLSPYQIAVSYGARQSAAGTDRARHRRRLVRPARSAAARSRRRTSPAAASIFRPATTSSPGRAPTSRSALPSCAPSPTPTICCASSSRRARTRWSGSAGASGRATRSSSARAQALDAEHDRAHRRARALLCTSPTASRAGRPGCARCSKTCSSSTRRRSIASARARGQLCALQQLDGATIKRVIDDWGRTPLPYRRRRRRDGLSAGLSAGAQRPAGRQLLGARHHLPAAQRARPQGLRLFAGAAGADDGQHRAAPPALAARLFFRRLDPRRADRRADGVDARTRSSNSRTTGTPSSPATSPGAAAPNSCPATAPPRCIRPRSRSTRTTSTNGSPASSASPFRCRRNGR